MNKIIFLLTVIIVLLIWPEPEVNNPSVTVSPVLAVEASTTGIPDNKVLVNALGFGMIFICFFGFLALWGTIRLITRWLSRR